MGSSIISFLIVLVTLVCFVKGDWPPCCESRVYCHGKLLDTVQMARIYPDSKTFVDMRMKYSEDEVLGMFDEMMEKEGNSPDKHAIKEFVDKAFDLGGEFVTWTPDDWTQEPALLSRIKDPEYAAWARDLNDLWKLLGRRISDEVRDQPSQYSIIYVPNPVIVPGGRFKEFYYWDSYWIIKGLILSEMHHTARGMLENFLSIVERFGFVPNGGRVYYSMRSQPPLLVPMVDTYLEATGDVDFLKDAFTTLEKEFDFWIKNRTLTVEKNGRSYMLARYADSSSGPRPESYREDVSTAAVLPPEQRDAFYSQLKSAAESGWDFSSRWFVDKNGDNNGNLTNVKTKTVVPVDLNAMLCGNAVTLARWARQLGLPQAEKYEGIAHNWQEAVTAVFWHEDVGAWLDWDHERSKRRDHFYPSNLFPLWTGCFDKSRSARLSEKVTDYLERRGISGFPGGVPTSLEYTGEQWDLPNAWPPLQAVLVEGLSGLGGPAERWARGLATAWLRSNYRAYNETGHMFEKYDATVSGGHGGGGEYDVQLGFGWSNGVVLELLDKYGGERPERMREGRAEHTAGSHPASSPSLAVLPILLGLSVGR